MIISLLKIKPLPSKRREVFDLLHYIQEPTRVDPDCLDCSVYEEEDDESILYMEKWKGKEGLYEHIKSGPYMGILAAMELSTAPPEMTLVEAQESDGMELIKALRSA